MEIRKLAVRLIVRFRGHYALLGTLSNDDGDAKDDASEKILFLFYRRISQVPRSVQFVYRFKKRALKARHTLGDLSHGLIP